MYMCKIVDICKFKNWEERMIINCKLFVICDFIIVEDMFYRISEKCSIYL